MRKDFKYTLVVTIATMAAGFVVTVLPHFLGSRYAPEPVPARVWEMTLYGGGLVVVLAIGVAIFMLFWPLKAESVLDAIHSGGRGGSARVVGRNSGAEGGAGGQGGIGPGGPGGDAEVVGDQSYARGGDGGNSGQVDGRGGRRTMSQGERLNLPTSMWPFGYGGAGANAPEYNRRLQILTQIRAEYMQAFPVDALFINAGIVQVSTRWVNKRLEEMGETWRVGLKDGGYEMPPLSKPR